MSTIPAPGRGGTGDARGPIVLALNSGSSSLKFGLYRVGYSDIEMLLSGQADSIGGSDARFSEHDSCRKEMVSETASVSGQQEAIGRIARLLTESNMPAPTAIGHRIVHGGPNLRQHCVIDDAVLRQLTVAAPFAPLHTPAASSVIRSAMMHFPGLVQMACFDITFHAVMPDVARGMPIPRELRSEGIRRYGFHGLSIDRSIDRFDHAATGR